MIPNGTNKTAILILMETFSDWLEQQLTRREWSVSDLARKANTRPASLSRVLNETRQAGPEICLGIAKALDLPPELVFRKAGLLPPEPEHTSEEKEAIYLLRGMSPERRQYILTTMRALATGTPVPASRTSR